VVVLYKIRGLDSVLKEQGDTRSLTVSIIRRVLKFAIDVQDFRASSLGFSRAPNILKGIRDIILNIKSYHP
jgi:hypothetical protein